MEISIEKLNEFIDTITNYIKVVNDFVKNNQLEELREFKDLRDKEIIGKDYRDAQNIYEEYSRKKSMLMSSIGFIDAFNLQANAWRKKDQVDKVREIIDNLIKLLDSNMYALRERLRFYQNIIFLIANFGYGDY